MLKQELSGEGQDINVLAINSVDAVDHQQKLTDRCAFPVFQDTDAVGAWTLHGGSKDDFLIYDAAGKLIDYLPAGGVRSTNLSQADGYATVKQALSDAVSASN